MTTKLPAPPQSVGPVALHLAQTYRLIEHTFELTVKRGQDYEVGPAKIWLTAPDGSRYYLTVDNAGNIGTDAGTPGGGTVTSVAVADATGITWAGSPVTTSGTFTPTLSANLQAWHGLATSSKANSSLTISTTAPLTGGGDLTANRTLAISAATTSAAGSMSAADKIALDAAAEDSGWIAPTLVNSWTDFGSPFAAAAYRKVGKTVYVRGLIGGGTFTAGTTITTLPVGFRPTSHRLFCCITNGGFARVDMRSDGIIQLNAPTGTNAFLSIDGLIFQVD